MRKKWFRKGMSLCLTAAMALGLTACGGTDKVSADPNLAKQYVYSCQDIEIPQMGDSFDIQRGYFSDGKIYLLANVYNWNDTGSSQELRLISLNEDGTGLQEIELQTSAAGSGAAGQEGEAQEETPDEEAGQNQEETGDNDLMILPRAEAAQEETDAEADAESEEESQETSDAPMVEAETAVTSVYEYTGYANYTFTGDGMLYAVKTYSYEDYSDPENVVSRQENSLCKWDMEGTLLGEYPLETIDYQQEYAYITALVPLSDGGMGVLYTGDGVQMSTVDAQGNVSERRDISEALLRCKTAEILW